MVAPLIVGAARVVGAGSKTAVKKSRVGRKDTQSIRNTALEERRSNRFETPLSTEEHTKQNANTKRLLPTARKFLKMSKGRGGSQTDDLSQKIKASVAASTIFWSLSAFYIAQLTFWVFGISALALKSTFLVGYLVPGQEMYFITWLVIAFIGFGSMSYAAIVFIARGVDCFSGWKGFIFILCLTGYLVLFINFAPWFIAWVISVVLMQEGEKE